ncbi:unnamed protein product [Moneuplotes crassus]|uniref:Uncharacterized protein n=1 Tax=Euplotes crassus TaxID=5936 RepID=A0AAD2D2Z6_EUPCR|nr:unnamed protein product [Moneuplotes crassus]
MDSFKRAHGIEVPEQSSGQSTKILPTLQSTKLTVEDHATLGKEKNKEISSFAQNQDLEQSVRQRISKVFSRMQMSSNKSKYPKRRGKKSQNKSDIDEVIELAKIISKFSSKIYIKKTLQVQQEAKERSSSEEGSTVMMNARQAKCRKAFQLDSNFSQT